MVEMESRKGPWTPEEDKLLAEYVSQNGEGRWSSVARFAGLNRNAKSCRLRWVNYLRPGLKRGHLTPQEEGIIIELQALWGNKQAYSFSIFRYGLTSNLLRIKHYCSVIDRWSTIARYLPGRTDNEVKNYWRTHFKRRRKTSEKQERRRIILPTREKQKEVTYEEKKVEAISNESVLFEAKEKQENVVLELENAMLPTMYEDFVCCPDTIPIDSYLWGELWNQQLNNCSKMATANSREPDAINMYGNSGGYIY